MESSTIRWLCALACLAATVSHDAARAAPLQAGYEFAQAVQQLAANDSQAALASWRRLAIELPGSSEVNNNLAVALARCGLLDEARQAIERASRLQPAYASIHQNLSMPPSAWMVVEVLPEDASGRTAAMTPEIAEQSARSLTDARDARQLASLREAHSAMEILVEKLTALPEGRQARVEAAFEAWADAWRSRDVEAYLATYATEFAAPDHESWAARRRERIASRAWIQLRIQDAEWTLPQGDVAIVKFVQHYASPVLRERSAKQLTWRLVDGRWQIVDERTLPR
jgi:ketosteroid isomerase-like protein